MKISSGCLAIVATILSTVVVAIDFHGSTNLKPANMHRNFAAKLSSAYSQLDLVTIPSPFPPPNGTYSDTGYLYLTNSFESDCSSPVLTYGVSVDKCTLAESFSYKIQLVQDSCVDAIVQYFRDEECTNYAGSSDLEPYANNCTIPEKPILYGGDNTVYDILACTTSPLPAISADSGVFMNYENNTVCDSDMATLYVAYACNACVAVEENFSFIVDCDTPSTMAVAYYPAAGCAGTPVTVNYPDTCTVDTDGDDGADDGDDDDTYIPPFINPPPSISTTAFPTVANTSIPESTRVYCQFVPDVPIAVPTVASSRMPTTRPPTAAHSTAITFKAKSTLDTASGAWIQVANTTGMLWTGVAADSTGKYLAACSNGNGTFVSNDYGWTWIDTQNLKNISLFNIASSASGAIVIVSSLTTGPSTGGVYISTNYGYNWTKTSLSTSEYWYGVSCDDSGQNMAALHDAQFTSGTIYYSTDGGASWSNSNAPNKDWSAIACDSTGQYLVANTYDSTLLGGGMYRSNDYGERWTSGDIDAQSWYSIASDSSGENVVSVNHGGGIFTSSNSGGIWHSQTNPGLAWFSVTSDSTGMYLMVAASDGGIYRSVDYGKDWYDSGASALGGWTSVAMDSTGQRVFATSSNHGIYIANFTFSAAPTKSPSQSPTMQPSLSPTVPPSVHPSVGPSANPTTVSPTIMPTVSPSTNPTLIPTSPPSATPSITPSAVPSAVPSALPTVTGTAAPTFTITVPPTVAPTVEITALPSLVPSVIPSAVPSATPTMMPTASPTVVPSLNPTAIPSPVPSTYPICIPTTSPTPVPSASKSPSSMPTPQPTPAPTHAPTLNATSNQQVSFYSYITFTGLSSVDLDTDSQNCIVATSAAVMSIAISRVSFISSDTVNALGSRNHVLKMLDTSNPVQVTVLTQVPLAGAPYSSPDALYSSLSSALFTSVADGAYNSLLQVNVPLYNAAQMATADATVANSSAPTVDTIPITEAPTAQPTASPAPFNSHLALELSSALPGLAMIVSGLMVLYFRRSRSGSLNEMHMRWGGEYSNLALRSVTVFLAVNVLFAQSFTAVNHKFVLLLLSRLLILTQSMLCFGIFISPGKGELNRSTSMSQLMNTEALQDKGANTVYSCVIIASMFDTSMLRYLPWYRTTFTRVMEGYPNTLLLRCSLYGTFLSSLLQAIALAPSLHPSADSGTETSKALALLVFSILNLVRSFVSIVLTMKRANSAEFNMAIVSEKDVIALTEFVKSSAASESSQTAEALREVRSRHSSFTPDKVSEMLSTVQSRTASMRLERASNQNTDDQNAATESPMHQPDQSEVDSLETSEQDDIQVDERGIRFSTNIVHADETMTIMREQMRTAGLTPLEFIPLPKLKAELATLFESANTGVAYDTDRLDYLLLCLEHNPEHKAELEALHKAWLQEITPFLQESLEITRSYVPPHIFKCSEDSLEADGYSRALAKRIINKKCLWLVRVSTTDINRMHVVELSGRFNPEAQGMDLNEIAAIFAVLPDKFSNDPDRRKARWRASVEQTLKTMYAQFKSGTLVGPKKRNLAYKNQLPRYEGRDTLHDMGRADKSNAYAPRTSFLNLSLKSSFSGSSRSSALGKSTASPTQSSTSSVDPTESFTKRMGAVLTRGLPGRPLSTVAEDSGTDSRPTSVGKLSQSSRDFALALNSALARRAPTGSAVTEEDGML